MLDWWNDMDLEILQETVLEQFLKTNKSVYSKVAITGLKRTVNDSKGFDEFEVDVVCGLDTFKFSRIVRFEAKIYYRKVKLKELLQDD